MDSFAFLRKVKSDIIVCGKTIKLIAVKQTCEKVVGNGGLRGQIPKVADMATLNIMVICREKTVSRLCQALWTLSSDNKFAKSFNKMKKVSDVFCKGMVTLFST